MNEKQYLLKIKSLEEEIEYLHRLLDKAGILYKKSDEENAKTSLEKINLFEEDQGSRIQSVNITKQHVQYFYHMFKGRRDVYSKRSGKANLKTGKHGYYTQCWNFWKDEVCLKKINPQFSCSECNNQKYKELTGQIIYDHLIGAKEDASDVIGLYPMFPDETINFLVFDFDCHEDNLEGKSNNKWMMEVNAFRKICEINFVPILVERSRSGNGAHVWIFFEKPILASVARKFGAALLTKGAEQVNMKSFRYYDRMLPAQDHIPINSKTGKPGLGNLVALPLQGQALKKGNSAFVDENWNAYKNQWECLKYISKLSVEMVEEKIKEWSKDGILGILSSDFDDNIENENKGKLNLNPWDKNKRYFHTEDVAGKIEIVVSDKIYINSKNMKPRMQNAIRRMAAFSNSEFYKKAGMGLSTKEVPRIIFCGYDDEDYICLPRALLEPVLEKFKSINIDFDLKDNRCVGTQLDVSFKGELYEEQKRASKAILAHENGILAATTSFGKTVVGAYMIAQRKVNTLIVVHNTEILKNWVEDLEKFLDIKAVLPEYKTKSGKIKKRNSVIGKIYAGHNSLTGIIDVAIFASLGKCGDINPIIDEYGMVIMDECHHVAAQSIEDVIGVAKAKYVYGLTATPKREDGQEKKVFMQLGPIRFRYTAKERAQKQGIDHFVYPRFTRLISSVNMKVNEANRAVIENEQRNDQIVEDIEVCLKNGRTPIVLTKYKEHAKILYDKLQGKADHIYLLQGGGSKKIKDEMRQQMRNVPKNETLVLVAIDKYIGEGFNFPRLDTLMLTMPVASEGNVEQFAGRLHRDYETKKDVIIYDYVDLHIRVLEKMYHKRLRTYKKIGYNICNDIVAEKQEVNSIFDANNYVEVYKRDLLEANKEIIISSPGINRTKINAFIKVVKKAQENGVRITVVTLNPEEYPEDKIEDTKALVQMLKDNAINVYTHKHMHEHFAIIDEKIVWYGSMNLLSRAKDDDNLVRICSNEIAQELMEITFGRK